MNRINSELKAKWVAALRSGEYKQCRGQLTKDGGYCCLGVLAKISDRLGEDGRFKCSNGMGSLNHCGPAAPGYPADYVDAVDSL